MKKTLTFILGLILTMTMVSCEGINHTDNGAMTTTNGSVVDLKLVEVEFNGERHEYVYFHDGYGRSLSHWEGCKYCKENKN